MTSACPEPAEWAATEMPAHAKNHAFAGVFTLLAPHMAELDRFLHGQLGDFEPVRPQLQSYVATLAGYRRNEFTLDAGTRDRITEAWGDVILRYGYEPPAEPQESNATAPLQGGGAS